MDKLSSLNRLLIIGLFGVGYLVWRDIMAHEEELNERLTDLENTFDEVIVEFNKSIEELRNQVHNPEAMRAILDRMAAQTAEGKAALEAARNPPNPGPNPPE